MESEPTALAALLTVITGFALGIVEAVRRRRRDRYKQEAHSEERDLVFHQFLFQTYEKLIRDLRSEIDRLRKQHQSDERDCEKRIAILEREVADLRSSKP